MVLFDFFCFVAVGVAGCFVDLVGAGFGYVSGLIIVYGDLLVCGC